MRWYKDNYSKDSFKLVHKRMNYAYAFIRVDVWIIDIWSRKTRSWEEQITTYKTAAEAKAVAVALVAMQ